MRFGKLSTFTALVLAIGLFSGSNHLGVLRAYGAPSSAPVVGIWSNACNSFNITVSSCGSSLSTGSTISVQINVTNVIANEFGGYEFFLYYDPTFLSATSADTTSSVFPNSVIVLRSFTPAGTVHLVGVCLDCNNTGPGTIVNINFQILGIGVSPLTLAAGIVPNGSAQSFTELASGSRGGAVPLAPNTADGYFKNEPTKLGPVASFIFTPASAQEHQQINFTAAESFDPDNPDAPNRGISHYAWDFGNGFGTSSVSPNFLYSPSIPGTFSVRLTVTDTDNNFVGMETKAYTVSQTPFHDLLVDITVNPVQAYPGVNVTVGVTVVNNGTTQENYDLAVSYRFPTTTIIGSVTNQVISSPGSSSFNFVLHTAGLALGIYTVQANVTVLPSSSNPTGVDNIPANNVALTEFMILRADQPPVSRFTFSPQNPIIGLPVSFDGSGSVDPDGYITSWLWSFGDGQFGSGSFVTHVYSSAGSYTVTLTVLDNAGLLGVHIAIIHVLAPTTNNLSVSVSVGSVYFPGDTADIYVLVATGGTPISASAMNVTLVRPDGSKVMLGAVSIALGLYKASFSIPSTGPLGTYAIIVHVHTTGAGDGSALGTFEAKPSWLSAQGPKIAAGTAVIGIVSALVVWRGGYLRKKDGASSSF